MKEIKESIGIDVSKEKIDAHMHVCKLFAQFPNCKKGFAQMLSWIKKHSGAEMQQTMFCFEHTGTYSLSLAFFLSEKKLLFAMVPALEIKKSMGIVRGKNDKIDARRIAEYCHLRRDKLKGTVMPAATIIKMKALLTLRERMVTQRAGYKNCITDLKCYFKQSEDRDLFTIQQQMIKALSEKIKYIDGQIGKLINESEETKTLFDLITSIKGIGPVIAAHLIVTTNCFTLFENSRKFASYSGVAPFEKQSGTSLVTKSKVSHFANKKIKSLLTLAANNAVQTDPEMVLYYKRRLEKGKSRMSTINVVRNKLLHRIFAVVKRRTPYVEIQNWAA